MLKIRLMRIGAKKRPFYRVVVIDERNKRGGAYIESVGTYNPLTKPKEIKLKLDRIEHWLKMGAQKSDGLLRILKEAPQRPARKPKKGESGKAEAAANKSASAEKKEEVVEEAPAETVEEATTEVPSEPETPVEVAEETKTEEPAQEVAEEKKEGE